MSIGCLGGFNFLYFSKDKKLTKSHIYSEFIGDSYLMAYLLDESDIGYLQREFLLSVLFFGARDKYLKLYEIYKDIQLKKLTTGNISLK